MNWKNEYKPFLWILGFFLFAYYLPLGSERFNNAVLEGLQLARWYAREHVLLCLVPAFFIAGTIAVFVSQAAVIKYFGASANKWLSYLVASVSGTILAIILTARILGMELGIARVVGAVSFSVIIGLIMHFIYRREEREKAESELAIPGEDDGRPLWQTAFHFFVLVGILIFATWGKPEGSTGLWHWIYSIKWWLVTFFGILLAFSLIRIMKIKALWVILSGIPVLISVFLFPNSPLIPFIVAIIMLSILLSLSPGEPEEWMSSTWGFTKQILPLLGAGVLVAGFLLGSPIGGQGIIPNQWIATLVGGNSLFSNLFASVAGAFMYFATLTEVPILQGLLASGMGKGPALALLLAGPALSLPNMLVIRSVIGTQKTVVFVSLVIVMATITGLLFGYLF
ncbi:MAG: permease [Calditrichota bacterium]